MLAPQSGVRACSLSLLALCGFFQAIPVPATDIHAAFCAPVAQWACLCLATWGTGSTCATSSQVCSVRQAAAGALACVRCCMLLTAQSPTLSHLLTPPHLCTPCRRHAGQRHLCCPVWRGLLHAAAQHGLLHLRSDWGRWVASVGPQRQCGMACCGGAWGGSQRNNQGWPIRAGGVSLWLLCAGSVFCAACLLCC